MLKRALPPPSRVAIHNCCAWDQAWVAQSRRKRAKREHKAVLKAARSVRDGVTQVLLSGLEAQVDGPPRAVDVTSKPAAGAGDGSTAVQFGCTGTGKHCACVHVQRFLNQERKPAASPTLMARALAVASYGVQRGAVSAADSVRRLAMHQPLHAIVAKVLTLLVAAVRQAHRYSAVRGRSVPAGFA